MFNMGIKQQKKKIYVKGDMICRLRFLYYAFCTKQSPIFIKTSNHNLSYIIFHPNFHSLMKNREVKWVLPRVEIEVNTHCWDLLTPPNRINDLHLILEMASILIELYRFVYDVY